MAKSGIAAFIFHTNNVLCNNSTSER